jgi:hypothetical protein
MRGFVHTPERWDRKAATLWAAGRREEAAKRCLEVLDGDPSPDADAFIQPGFYLFQLDRFDVGTAVLERGLDRFPDHPMILLSLGSSYNRWGKHDRARPLLDRFIGLGFIDASAFDALASSNAALGDFIAARLYGTLALAEKDNATAERHGCPPLKRARRNKKLKKVIAFTLFGSNPRYLRGALQNILAARALYPGWRCRFYVDDSVDEVFRQVIADEGAEVVVDYKDEADIRHRLTRRFLVSDDPKVGHFMVRDCDSVVSPREAAAVAEWIESGLPFHAMRDWYTHTDPMLAGMWGGIAGVFPAMGQAIARFTDAAPLNTNWDQYFLRDQVWPAIRDHVMVHDRYFSAHRAQPFPTPTPGGREHVGQNEFVSGKKAQESALAAFAERVPALGLARAVKLNLNLG